MLTTALACPADTYVRPGRFRKSLPPRNILTLTGTSAPAAVQSAAGAFSCARRPNSDRVSSVMHPFGYFQSIWELRTVNKIWEEISINIEAS